MNITTAAEISAEPQLPARKPLPNLLVKGFALARRNWPLIVLAYAINLIFGLLAAVPFSNGLAPLLDHSVAAQKISGTLDLGALTELALHLRETHFFPMVLETANWLNLLQALIMFLLFAGTVFVYVSGEAPKVSVLLRGGVAYFWRFVRAALMVGSVASCILGLLLIARAALLARLALVYPGRTVFVYAAITGAVVFLAALLLRLWFDLVEVYIVRHSLDGELRVHRSLWPACRLLGRYFFRILGSFLLTGVAGVGALGGCLLLWKSLPANLVWLAALLAQVGLLLLLAGRFWQRGVEAALVLAAYAPAVGIEAVSEETVAVMQPEQVISLEGVAGITSLAEPTLSELVQKLRTEPWAAKGGQVAVLRETEAVVETPLDRHTAKFPLGGATPKEEPGADGLPGGKLREE